LAGQKPPDGLPPLSTPDALPVPPLLPPDPALGDVPPLLPPEPLAWVLVVVVLLVVVVGCVVDVDVVVDRVVVVVGWGFGVVRVVVGVVSARGTWVVVVVALPPPQPAVTLAAAIVVTRATAIRRPRGAVALRSVRAAPGLMSSRLGRAGEARSRGSR
jgi:hypothetical protein